MVNIKVYVTCHYCGHVWEDVIYQETPVIKCRCGESNQLKVQKLEDAKVDYYVSCPEFPEDVVKPIEDSKILMDDQPANWTPPKEESELDKDLIEAFDRMIGEGG